MFQRGWVVNIREGLGCPIFMFVVVVCFLLQNHISWFMMFQSEKGIMEKKGTHRYVMCYYTHLSNFFFFHSSYLFCGQITTFISRRNGSNRQGKQNKEDIQNINHAYIILAQLFLTTIQPTITIIHTMHEILNKLTIYYPRVSFLFFLVCVFIYVIVGGFKELPFSHFF